MVPEDNYLYFRRNNQADIFNFTSNFMPKYLQFFDND